MEPIGFHGILVLLGVAVVPVALRYLRQLRILAYLCASIVMGSYGMAESLTRKTRVHSPCSGWCLSSAGAGRKILLEG